GDDLLAVLGDHVVGGPVDGLLELSVDRLGVLGPATVDGDGVVVVEAGRASAADPVAMPLVEEAGPKIGGIDDVGVGVEDSEPVPHHSLLILSCRSQYSRRNQARARLGQPDATAGSSPRYEATRADRSVSSAADPSRTIRPFTITAARVQTLSAMTVFC